MYQALNTVFELGKLNVITVIGEAYDSDTTDNTVTVEDVWTYNRNTLDEAIKLAAVLAARSNRRKSRAA